MKARNVRSKKPAGNDAHEVLKRSIAGELDRAVKDATLIDRGAHGVLQALLCVKDGDKGIGARHMLIYNVT